MKWLKFLPPTLIVLVFFLFVYKKPFPIFPNQESWIGFYSDTMEQGNTRIHEKIRSDTLASLSYTLGKGIQFPYAGVAIGPSSAYFPDFSAYDYIDVDICTEQSRSVQCFLNVYEPGVTKDTIPISSRHVLYEIPVRHKPGLQRLWIKDFKTPIWWYSRVNLTEKDLGDPHLDKVKGLSFSCGLLLNPDTKDSIRIRSITLGKSYTTFFVWTLALLLVYYGLLYLIVKYRKRKVALSARVIPYRPLEIEETGDPLLHRSVKYLSERYSDSELTLSAMAHELGLSGRKISDRIKAHFKLTFKQYINSIRINEAKRLLKESALPVNEIAYKVGFSNVTHFNRAFRQYCNCSPQEFRTEKAEK